MDTLPTVETTAEFFAHLTAFSAEYAETHPELGLTTEQTTAIVLRWELDRPIMKG